MLFGSIFAASNWQFISVGTFVAALFVASLGFQLSVVEWLHILEKTLEMPENIYITEDNRYINIYSETVIKQPCSTTFKKCLLSKKKTSKTIVFLFQSFHLNSFVINARLR